MSEGYKEHLVKQLQAKGYTYRQSKRAVASLFAIIRDALKKGESVETPIGDFYIAHNRAKRLWRLGKIVNQGQETFRIRFRGEALDTDAERGDT